VFIILNPFHSYASAIPSSSDCRNLGLFLTTIGKEIQQEYLQTVLDNEDDGSGKFDRENYTGENEYIKHKKISNVVRELVD
jgi:Zn-finger nucleic acid-binding protein